MRPLDDASLGRCVPWTKHPLTGLSRFLTTWIITTANRFARVSPGALPCRLPMLSQALLLTTATVQIYRVYLILSSPGFRIRIHFLRIRIRIQMIRMEANTDPDPGLQWPKIEIYLSLGLHKVCPGYRRSLQLTKEPIQHFKTWIFFYFCGSFLPSWIRIRIQITDPDPKPWIHRISSGDASSKRRFVQARRGEASSKWRTITFTGTEPVHNGTHRYATVTCIVDI